MSHIDINMGTIDKPTRPLEQVVIDYAKLDLFVSDDDNNLLGRPTITIALDVYTHYPLGFNIGFEPPSDTSVMNCLSHAILPKTYVKDKYPEVNNEWMAYGLPELLVVDNSKEFQSKRFIDTTHKLGIEVKYRPVKTPKYKGYIERLFGNLNTQLSHSIPGSTFSKTIDDKEYESQSHITISLKSLKEILHNWVIDFCPYKFTNGSVPLKAWERYYESNPLPPLPFNKLDWKLPLMNTEYRIIGRTGVRMYHLFYRSPELIKLRERHLRLKTNHKVEVPIKYDPTDLGQIYVYDDFEHKYHEVPCRQQECASGLNLYAHKLKRKYISKQTQEKLNKDAFLAELKAIIHNARIKRSDSKCNKNSNKDKLL